MGTTVQYIPYKRGDIHWCMGNYWKIFNSKGYVVFSVYTFPTMCESILTANLSRFMVKHTVSYSHHSNTRTRACTTMISLSASFMVTHTHAHTYTHTHTHMHTHMHTHTHIHTHTCTHTCTHTHIRTHTRTHTPALLCN